MSTTFPIDVTPERLIEFLSGPGLGTIRTISLEEIGRDVYAAPSPTVDDAAGVIMLVMALEGQSGEQIRAWLHASDEAAAWRNRPPEPVPAPIEPGDETGPIAIERPVMVDETGECWQWRGFTDFLLFGALDWTPRAAPLWAYQRGDMGSEQGIGNMPILHDDALESRSYCKGDGATEWCVQIQTSRAHATARDGWRIVEEPRKGFVKLVRP